MAGGKTSTRQKLINMLYLVLTAMLALNISKEILESFISIDRSQEASRLTAEEELTMNMAFFEAQSKENPEKFSPNYQKAYLISIEADSLLGQIQMIKANCIAETEGLPLQEVYDPVVDTVLSIEHVQRKDDYDVSTNILYGPGDIAAIDPRPEDAMNLRATALRENIETYKASVVDKVDYPALHHSMDMVFDFSDRPDSDGELQSWERTNFYRTPLAANLAILSKLQSDIRNTQLTAVKVLLQEVEGDNMKFTALKGAVIPTTLDVSQGGRFQADVFLAAYDDTNPPEIRLAAPDARVDEESLEIIGDYELIPVDSTMMGNIDIPAAGLGNKHREGVIIFRPAGLPEVRKKFVLDYQVSAPMAIVSPTNMNVLYKGVDNPITVGVPGFQPEDVTARISNGSLSRSSTGGYIARVTNGTEAQVTLSAQLPDGGTRTLAPVKFRVKSVPDPIAKFAGKTAKDSRVSRAELRAAQGCLAEMPDFLFPVRFNIISFDITMKVGDQVLTRPSDGNRLSQNQKQMIERARSGQKVSIENINVRGPAGERRKLASINLTVN